MIRQLTSRVEVATFLLMLLVVLISCDNLLGSQLSDGNVVPILETAFKPIETDKQSLEFCQKYYDSIERWGRIVRKSVVPVPGREGQSYVGLDSHKENDVRATAYCAMTLSFLARCQPPQARLDDKSKQEIQTQAIGLIRYLASSHVANNGKCLNGEPWGKQWQSALWARSAAMAAWQLWPSLDAELQQAMLRLIEFEADRFIDQPPKSSVANDTGAEENAWNASITSLAYNMMPNHPRAQHWDQSAKRYMYNTFSVNPDKTDSSVGDDQRPIQDWVSTVNAHDNFTVENHGLVHIGYLKTSAAMLLENATHWIVTGGTPPKACMHHVPEVFEVLSKCTNWNAAAIYFSGNDWHLYETQCSDIILYTLLRQLHGDQQAAHLEDVAIEHVLRWQAAEDGYYSARRDLEYGGVCATRLISCYYAHAATDSLVPAMTLEQFDRAVNGVTYLQSANTIIHRTSEKFASFTWAQKRMALAIPSSESSVIWPHFSSYIGIFNGKQSSSEHCKLQNLNVVTSENGFQVSGTLVRCKGKLMQDFIYASSEKPYTVYLERLRPSDDFQFQYRKTGLIGLEYEIGNNQRTLFGDFGSRQILGTNSPQENVTLESDWLNIDNRIGYVVRRTDRRDNQMMFHDKNVREGRKAHLQESIALISDTSATSKKDKRSGHQFQHENNWACIVTFLNQSADQTRRATKDVQLTTTGEKARVQIGDGVLEFQIGE